MQQRYVQFMSMRLNFSTFGAFHNRSQNAARQKAIHIKDFLGLGQAVIFPVLIGYPLLERVIRMFSTGFSTFLWTIVDILENYVENSFPLSKR